MLKLVADELEKNKWRD